MIDLHFPDTKSGDVSDLTFTLTNSTGSPIAVTGTFPAPWHISRDGVVFSSSLSNLIIDAGATHTLSVRLYGNTEGVYSSTIVLSLTGLTDEDLNVDGTIIDSLVSVPDDITYLPEVMIGDDIPIGTFVVSNNSTVNNMRLEQYNLPDGFHVGANEYIPESDIGASSSVSFILSADPLTKGDYSFTATIAYSKYEEISASDGVLIDSAGVTIIE